MKSTDSTMLTLRDPVFQDFSETVDTTLQRHPAKIIYGNSSIRYNKKPGKHLSKIILTGKKLQISLSDKSRSQIELVDINGRILTKRIENSQQISMDCNNNGTGMFILRIFQHGVITAYPLIIN
jgi:hypothetical protein